LREITKAQDRYPFYAMKEAGFSHMSITKIFHRNTSILNINPKTK